MLSRIRDNPHHVFDCFCEVVIPTKADEKPWIVQKFPDSYQNEETLKMVPQFTFPCDFERTTVQHFSFVLTNLDSKWTFGFCRHAPDKQTALVLLSAFPWHDTFFKLLNCLADLTGSDDQGQLWTCLQTLHGSPVPDRGGPVTVPLPDGKNFSVTSTDHYSLPCIPQDRNLTEYFNAVDTNNMMVMFASMLYERRIVVTSRKLSRLSACVQAANSVIYPMSWQHIFIPVLPASLMDYLSAPMPFVIGASTSVMQRTKMADIGEAVILDADNNRIDTPFNDLETLPQEVVTTLKRELKNPNNMLGDGVARVFLRALVKLIGGYRDALRFPQDCAKITFDQDAFVLSRPAHIQPFLEKMLHLQIFHQFITERLEMLNSGQGFSDEFELEACHYSEKSNSRLAQQYKEWTSNVRKEGGAFLKTVRSKTNPAIKSAVKGVKETGKSGSKQVKSAYKNIKSRLKDIQQPAAAPGDRLDEEADESQPRSAPSSPGSTRARRGISRGTSAVTYRRQPTAPLARVGGRAAATQSSMPQRVPQSSQGGTQSSQTIKYHVIDPAAEAAGPSGGDLFEFTPPSGGTSLLDEVLGRLDESKEADLIRLDSAEDDQFDPLKAPDRGSSVPAAGAVPGLGPGPLNGARPANGAVHNPVYPYCVPGRHISGVPLPGGHGGYPLSVSRSAASVLSPPAAVPGVPGAAPAPAPRRQLRQVSQSSEELLREYGLDFKQLGVSVPHRDPAAPPPAPGHASAPVRGAPAQPPPPLPPKSARWTTFE